MAAWKVAPALAAGCAAVLKPSELASLTCLELGQVCIDVGLPAGVLNILTGLGPDDGAPLACHPEVDKLAFTGSNATGSKIMSSASQVVKPVTMELGGKSPIVVFEDVDLDKAAEWTAFGCFWTNGQICSATSRLIVHEKIVVAFLDRLVKWVKNIKICDPFEEGCRLGPVISQGQYCFRREVTNAVEKEVTVCEKELVGRSMMQDNGASSQKKPKDIDLWRNAGKEAGERRKDRDFGEGERPEKRTRCDGKDNADVHIICAVEKEKSVCLVPTDSSQVANLEARLRHCALVADRCRSIVYKVGECMQELLKMWKEYESYQGDKTKESSSQGI